MLKTNVLKPWQKQEWCIQIVGAAFVARMEDVLDLYAADAPPRPLVCFDEQFIRTGQPIENCFIESFNGRLRDECLNEIWFVDLADAQRTIEAADRLQQSAASQRPREPHPHGVCQAPDRDDTFTS